MTMAPATPLHTARCMFPRRQVALLALSLLLHTAFAPAAENFSGARAYAILQVLVRDIGPRPMGSPAEQQALAFAAAKFREYGCDTSYIMPLTAAGGVNTSSGIAVGIARGSTGRMIVIGGHMDSSEPDIPGANDDGSGSACVIELARVLAPRPHQSTFVFCCFGGEEQGLRGSRHFVDEFPLIDSVALMLQIDMADGASYLEVDPDAPFQVSAPRWLPAAAFDIFYNELGFSNLRYVTHAATLNASFSGAAGSDHHPFLEKGIPAIDFTSDVSHPIHTPLDNLANFDSSGLARSGMLVQRLAERFDGGVPSRDTDRYYLLQVGPWPVFVDYWMLWLIHALTFALAGVATVRLWSIRVRDKKGRPRWSGLKVLLGVLIIQAFVWIPETIMGALRGYRFPWVNNFGGYVLLALLAGAVGLWFAIRVISKMGIRSDPFPFFARVAVILGVITLSLSIANPEIAIYPGSALLFFSLAVLIRHPIVKAGLALAALYLPLHLVFFEYLGLFQREMSQAVLTAWWGVALVDVLYVLGFMALSLPFAHGMAAVVRSSGRDLFLLKLFRQPRTLLLLVPAVIVVAIVLLGRPVYDARWQRIVDAEQRYVIGSDSSALSITSGESLDGLHMVIAGVVDTMIHGRGNSFTRELGSGSGVGWVAVAAQVHEAADTATGDSLRSALRHLEFRSGRRPLELVIRYSSEEQFELSSSWAVRSRAGDPAQPVRRRVLHWYAFPDSILDVPVHFRLKPGQKVVEEIRLVFPELAVPARFERDLTIVTTRTIVTRTDTLVVN